MLSVILGCDETVPDNQGKPTDALGTAAVTASRRTGEHPQKAQTAAQVLSESKTVLKEGLAGKITIKRVLR